MPTHASRPLGLLVPLLLVAACGGGGGGSSSFQIRNTTRSVFGTAPITVGSNWMVYLANENLSNEDLNGDGTPTNIDIAIAVNLSSAVETVLGVAPLATVILVNEVYLVVDESVDGVDRNGANGANDVLLLHWSETAGAVSVVDVITTQFDPADPNDVPAVAAGGRLYYAAEATPAGDETTLRFVSTTAPTTPNVVSTDAGGTLRPEILGMVEGLVFLRLDESVEGVALNGDGTEDGDDVLALLDGTDVTAGVVNVGVAIDSAPVFDARGRGAGDWLVGFLADEAGEGVSLNDQADFANRIAPIHCDGLNDTDTLDEVLFWIEFADFVAGMPDTLVNSGLAGEGRVVVVDGFLATISPEDDANCDLNDDGDSLDDDVRFVPAVFPPAPCIDETEILALASALPGGANGLARLGRRFVAVVDEDADGRDHDGKVQDHDLAAWLDPSDSNPTWDFTHQSSTTRSFGTGVFDSHDVSEPFAGVSWMAPGPIDSRLPITFLEEVPGTNPDVVPLNNNLDCNLVFKDADLTDALPVWADFESGPTLDWDGVGFAVDPSNAGITIARGFAFFRVDENDDNVDYNGDGDMGDKILFRNPLTTCGPVAMATASSIDGLVIVTDGDRGAGFYTSEIQAGVDLNGDGDATDLVVRFFRF